MWKDFARDRKSALDLAANDGVGLEGSGYVDEFGGFGGDGGEGGAGGC